jgi:KUP system potassium uptake protein
MSKPAPGADQAVATAGEPDGRASDASHKTPAMSKLVLGAVGVVFGDIGTSPLYALKESFVGHHPLAVDRLHIYGVLSLIFWSMTIVVTFKYVMLMLRADNKGEGGSMALLALITRTTAGGRLTGGVALLGVFATALFYGDSMITPAISVLSAVEGLTVVQAGFAPLVTPIAVVILVGLFLLQARGTDLMGRLFGPVTLIYFAVLAILGLVHVIARPDVLQALNPIWAVRFFIADGFTAFLALGSVVLAITGAEALYADMGHFGRKPIRAAWIYIVMPALMLNYLGQSALLLAEPDAAANPFFLMAPEHLRLPLVILATLATIIASQAVISGAFSVTHQAIQLGFIPRLRIAHTSASTVGQVYIPAVNWALLVMVLVLVLTFGQSSNLAAAYGIAVTGTMLITTCMISILIFRVWKWPKWVGVGVVGMFLLIDIAYFLSNLTKVPDGGWFPLLVGFVIFTILTTWAKGRRLMIERMVEAAMPIKVFIASAANSATRVPGTAVFMTSTPDGVPHALLHNLKHNKVLHERVVLLTVKIEDIPYVDKGGRVDLANLGQGFYRLVLHYGFMQEPDVPAALAEVTECGAQFRMIDTSFFLARQTLLPSSRPGMAIWREKLFAWMMRNSESAMDFFRLPTNRVVELGSQVEI